MNYVTGAIIVIEFLIMLAGVGYGLFQAFRNSDRDAQLTRVRGDAADYLQKLNYVEPRLRAVEQQNEVLLALHNPTEQLDKLHTNDMEILRVLNAQHDLLEDIDREMYRDKEES